MPSEKISLASRTARAIALGCHQAPGFLDFAFHNAGVWQEDDDTALGSGVFLNLYIPSNGKRIANFNAMRNAPAEFLHRSLSQDDLGSACGVPEVADRGLR